MESSPQMFANAADRRTIRMVVVDPHPMTREGVRTMLEDTEIEIVGEPRTADEIVEVCRQRRADVLLLDPHMQPSQTLELSRRLKTQFPDLAILIFSGDDRPANAVRTLSHDTNGCVSKSCTRSELAAAIRRVMAGKHLWMPYDMRRISVRSEQTAEDVILTQREIQVLTLIVEGRSNKEIGQQLFISAETVKEHVQHMLRKIGVWDRTQLAVWAVRHELV